MMYPTVRNSSPSNLVLGIEMLYCHGYCPHSVLKIIWFMHCLISSINKSVANVAFKFLSATSLYVLHNMWRPFCLLQRQQLRKLVVLSKTFSITLAQQRILNVHFIIACYASVNT